MALTDCTELQERLGNLKRVPCPKAPVQTPIPFKDVTLKPVVPKVDKGNEKIVDNTEEETPTVANGPRKKRTLSVKELAKSMEAGNRTPATRTKPVVGAKPVLRPKPSPAKNDEKPQRPSSVIDKPRYCINSLSNSAQSNGRPKMPILVNRSVF